MHRATLPDASGTLLMLLVVGLVYALAYGATGNLFVPIAAHALANAPTLLFQPQGPEPTLVLLGGLIVLCLAWRPLARIMVRMRWRT